MKHHPSLALTEGGLTRLTCLPLVLTEGDPRQVDLVSLVLTEGDQTRISKAQKEFSILMSDISSTEPTEPPAASDPQLLAASRRDSIPSTGSAAGATIDWQRSLAFDFIYLPKLSPNPPKKRNLRAEANSKFGSENELILPKKRSAIVFNSAI